ncbi:MAG: MFS transporter [Anaerolineae bacterium]|nr:MFS transporter [Anaerolineae bacterium]
MNWSFKDRIEENKNTFNEFPREFWVLMFGTFIDRLGGFMVFPFFSLYITDHFGVGMTQVGYMFLIFTTGGMFSSILGGAMTDKFGRKTMVLYGLFISGVSSLAIIFVDDLAVFFVIGALIGILGNLGGPAQQAMITDLLPEEKRTEGFGIFRVVFNVSAAIGPMLGGLMASRSYALLFLADAITSAITAVIVYKMLPETKPETPEGQAEESLAQSVGGYGKVFADRVYMIFLLISVLMTSVYMQMNITLPVYMRDAHGFEPRHYGYILSMNAAMVVLMQFWITRKIAKRPPLVIMAIGMAYYTVGFAMYGFIQGFVFFAAAMVVITIGEMVIAPVGQALVAKFAPEDMRGRYMAIFGFSWAFPNMFVPLLVGEIMDNYNPNWVWYACGIVGTVATLGYYWLHLQKNDIMLGEVTAEGVPA